MARKLQIRRDIEQNWSINNPVLSVGELGYAVDTDILKIGDGEKNWSQLGSFIPLSTDSIQEGAINLYFTDERALSATEPSINSASAQIILDMVEYVDNITTDDITEGSNLYFTNTRALDATEATIASSSAAAMVESGTYTDSQISSLINSAPETLNTLNELAAALNDDPDFYTTISSLIDEKLSTSDASANYLTILDADNYYITNLSASTLFVAQEDFDIAVDIAAESISASPIDINSQSASYTLQVSDFKKTIEMNSSSALVLTIDNDSSFPVGFYFSVTQTGNGEVSIAGASGINVNSVNDQTTLFMKYTSAFIYKSDANEWIMSSAGSNLVLRSSNGTVFEITVQDDGSLTTTEL